MSIEGRHFGVFLMVVGLVAPATLVGCRDDESPPAVDCTKAVVPKFGAMTVWATCTNCHASTKIGRARLDAPSDVNFDSYAAAKVHASSSAGQVKAGKMPPSGYPQPTDAQKQDLYNWAVCGTPQ